MNDESRMPGCSPMDTQIFNLKLSVTATSAYIMIASMMGDGLKPDLLALKARWNIAEKELEKALEDLMLYKIVERHTGPDGGQIYLINPASFWQTPNA